MVWFGSQEFKALSIVSGVIAAGYVGACVASDQQAESQSAQAGQTCVANSAINLRAGPGTCHPIIGSLGAGQSVSVISGPTDSTCAGSPATNWLRVESAAETWAYGGLLSCGDQAPAERQPLFDGRILFEGSCAFLTAMSASNRDCGTPIFFCDGSCENARARGCQDSDHWLSVPYQVLGCGARVTIEMDVDGQTRSTWAYVRDASGKDGNGVRHYEVSQGVLDALGAGANGFVGRIYAD